MKKVLVYFICCIFVVSICGCSSKLEKNKIKELDKSTIEDCDFYDLIDEIKKQTNTFNEMYDGKLEQLIVEDSFSSIDNFSSLIDEVNEYFECFESDLFIVYKNVETISDCYIQKLKGVFSDPDTIESKLRLWVNACYDFNNTVIKLYHSDDNIFADIVRNEELNNYDESDIEDIIEKGRDIVHKVFYNCSDRQTEFLNEYIQKYDYCNDDVIESLIDKNI